MMKQNVWKSGILSAVALGILSLPAHAGVLQVNSMINLAPDLSIHWSGLGTDLDVVAPPTSVPISPSGSGTLTGSSTFTLFSGATYNGDFLPTDLVLSAYDLGGGSALSTGITLAFSGPVYGFGAQVQVNAFSAFTATLEAFDTLSASLGSVQVSSTVLGNGDGSAPFLGLLSTVRIGSVSITADVAGVAINDAGLVSAASGVPEPGTLALLLPALAGLAIRKRRR